MKEILADAWLADISKAQNILGWQPITNLKKIILRIPQSVTTHWVGYNICSAVPTFERKKYCQRKNISETDTISYTVHEIAKTDIENWIKNRIDIRGSVFSTAPIHLDLGDLYHNSVISIWEEPIYRCRKETVLRPFPGYFHLLCITVHSIHYIRLKNIKRTLNYTNRTYPFCSCSNFCGCRTG